MFKTNILQIIGEESVRKIEVIKTELKQLENNSRPSPVNIPNTNYFIDCDYVMMAVGSTSDKNIVNSIGVELDKRGKIIIDEDGRTSKPNVFAGGDLAGTKGTVAWASRAGRNAAKAIVKYLESGK